MIKRVKGSRAQVTEFLQKEIVLNYSFIQFALMRIVKHVMCMDLVKIAAKIHVNA